MIRKREKPRQVGTGATSPKIRPGLGKSRQAGRSFEGAGLSVDRSEAVPGSARRSGAGDRSARQSQDPETILIARSGAASVRGRGASQHPQRAGEAVAQHDFATATGAVEQADALPTTDNIPSIAAKAIPRVRVCRG